MAKSTLHNIRLSDIQKEVMATVQASPNETVAAEEILNGGQNYVGAKDVLVKLGLLNFYDNQATITDDGKDMMRKLNLIDDSDQLTDEGQKHVNKDDDQEGQQDTDQNNQMGQQSGFGQGDPSFGIDQSPAVPGTSAPFGESLSLIRSIHEDWQTYKQIQKFKKRRS